jgi:hypothetical protein
MFITSSSSLFIVKILVRGVFDLLVINLVVSFTLLLFGHLQQLGLGLSGNALVNDVLGEM